MDYKGLLEEIRALGSLLLEDEHESYESVASVLRDVINANTYIADEKGRIKGYSLIKEFECEIMRGNVLERGRFPEEYFKTIMSTEKTLANIPHVDRECSFVPSTKCMFIDKKTTIIPIYGRKSRLGTLVVAKYNEPFTDEDLIVCEYAVSVIGMRLMHDAEAKASALERKQTRVELALSTLSYSEVEAVINILNEIDGQQGLVVASKIADRVGITRSVIVNAMRKLESAGLIATKSLGMKGTFIKIRNELLLPELLKITKTEE